MKANTTIRRVTLLAGALLTLATGRSLAEAAAPEAAAITAIAEKFHTALAAGASKEVMSLLQADALIVEGGSVETRAEYERGHLGEDIAYARAVPAKQLSIVVRQEGDVAWVISISRVTGTFQGRPVDRLAAETMVLAKSVAGWGIRSLHWSSQRARK